MYSAMTLNLVSIFVACGRLLGWLRARSRLTLPIVVFASIGNQVSPAEPSRVEAFKLFLSSSACVSRIIFTDERDCDSKKLRTNLMAYCDGNYYLREIVALDNPEFPISRSNRMHSALFAGRRNGVRWQINGFGVGEAIAPNPDLPDPYSAFSEALGVIAGGIINLGPQEVRPGSFVWDGDQFRAEENLSTRGTAVGRVFTGRILVDKGFVTQLTIGPVKQFLYEYEASTNRPDWFPFKITLRMQGKCTKRWVFHQAVLGNPYEVAEVFAPEFHIAPEVRLVTLVSNGQTIIQPNKRSPEVVALVKTTVPDSAKKRAPLTMVRTVLAVMFFASLLSLGFLFRARWCKDSRVVSKRSR